MAPCSVAGIAQVIAGWTRGLEEVLGPTRDAEFASPSRKRRSVPAVL
jgi:hypothetical protein